jgi:hypothetical protein
MPSVRTEVTEITTGLAMLGYQSLDRALEVRPRHISHVTEAIFESLEQARASRDYDSDFASAWDNGVAFARSPIGLRGRPPWTLEWRGHHRPASKSIETIPADLRIDYVYLVSCKYHSRILHNAGPKVLFDYQLAPEGVVAREHWFEAVCAEPFRDVWQPIHQALQFPSNLLPSQLSLPQRNLLKAHLQANPVDVASTSYTDFVRAASIASAARWSARLTTSYLRAQMLWRLLRLQAAPYFVLGATSNGTPVRYRVGTPWDFAQEFEVSAFEVAAGEGGQPSVRWIAEIRRLADNETVSVEGHVEVRWAHGKLIGAPEAKVYLDSSPYNVPGYQPLEP